MIKMRMETVDVSPDLAIEILEKNTENRKLNKDLVKKYAMDMSSGYWDEDNGVPLIIDKDGVLKDGQHRLNAVIKSKKTIRFCIIYDVSTKSRIYDRGKNRSILDVADMQGCNINKVILSSAKRVFQRIGIKDYTDEGVINYIISHIEDFETAKRLCGSSKSRGKTNITRGSTFISIVYCALRSGVSEIVLKNFLLTIRNGTYSDESEEATITLRNTILDEKIKGNSYHGWTGIRALSNMIERTLYKYERGKPMKRIDVSSCNYYSKQLLEMDKREINKLYRDRIIRDDTATNGKNKEDK